MDGGIRRSASGFGLLLSLVCAPCFASRPVAVVKTDLDTLIRAAAPTRTQFAVLVPHQASLQSAGSWSVQGGIATWRYAMRIPTAISMSFHANKVVLPSSAQLVVRGGATFTYGARDVHRGALWSRITPGDTLDLTLTVAIADRVRASLEIQSLQAGYRSLGGGVSDHPVYRTLRAKAAGTSATGCVQNYECNVTASNAGPAAATVGLIIGNLYQCTGSLINDVPGDNVPYVLTARHCESGQLGGGNPGAATTVTVYWDAVSACGQPLGSLYDTSVVTQTGAATIVEQQDAWLIELDASPIVPDAQFAGFDASGQAVQGGYTIQHALGADKQFTEWFGQALAIQQSNVLGVKYSSSFWEVVNQLGNLGPGASGSALIDQNNHLVGSLSLGRGTSDSTGYESCPVSPPAAPNGSNGAADFTSLAAVWNSTADTTSSTGAVTVKSVLDPAGTGTVVAPSIPAATATFTSNTYSLPEGTPALLSWNASNATQCAASGGLSGDGWTGALPATGQQSLSEPSAGEVLYILTCTFSGKRTTRSSLTITWGSPIPSIQFAGPGAAWTTRPARLTWTSNLAPCSITGGSLSASGLPSSGSVTTAQNAPGDVNYQIVCGTGNEQIISDWGVTFVTPSVTFTANGTDRLLGQPLTLSWQSWADTCAPSGGAPNDGWTSTAFPNPGTSPSFSPNVSAVGTYTYTLACSSGPLSITKNLVITVENNAPYVTLSLKPTSYVMTGTPSDGFTLSWNSNLTDCYPSATPLLGGFVAPNFNAQGTATVTPGIGTYNFYVTCNPYGTIVGQVISAPVTATVSAPPPPTASLAISPTTVYGNQNFTVTWSSTYAILCQGSGGVQTASEIWGPNAPSGTQTFTPPAPGTYTFDLSCGSVDGALPNATAQATVTAIAGPPPVPTVKLTSTPGTLSEGANFTVSWTSTNTNSCAASGGGASGSPWSGTLATSGSQTLTASTVGSFTYTVECTGIEQQTAQASSIVSVNSPATVNSPPSAASGKSGGGGELDALSVACLTVLSALGWRRRAQTSGRRPRRSPRCRSGDQGGVSAALTAPAS
jgi:hypothetical protein